MTDPADREPRGYDDLYREFDSPLMRRIRQEAYGMDIGQHSWVTADELRRDVEALRLSPEARLLDLGCGPGGPLTFVAAMAGCRATGLDVSAPAIAAARARATELGVDALVALREADLDAPLPLEDGAFDAVMAWDVVLHVRDRAAVFREVARVLVPGGRFAFTDAGVLAGPVSSEEIELRSMHGSTRFVPPGYDEEAIERAGFRLAGTEDRTASVLGNAEGRLAARGAHRAELVALEGAVRFERQQRYLETVVDLSRRGHVRRVMYLAERHR
jgi:SAM-dependent methyltransferase